MAGWAQQQAGTSRPEWGTPGSWTDIVMGKGGVAPYGDDPTDAAWIKAGINYYKRKYVYKDCK